MSAHEAGRQLGYATFPLILLAGALGMQIKKQRDAVAPSGESG